MNDYNSGDWFGWNGGECPVHPETLVEVALPRGVSRDAVKASDCGWDAGSYPIIAFRVVKEHKEPREVWFQEGYMTGSWLVSDKYRPGAVLFREVIE